jgi:hypothetical protein
MVCQWVGECWYLEYLLGGVDYVANGWAGEMGIVVYTCRLSVLCVQIVLLAGVFTLTVWRQLYKLVLYELYK